MDFYQINVEKREETGKGPMRRLREAGFVPGNLYGLGRPNLNLTIPAADLEKFFEAPSHLVELRLGDKGREAIVREVQIDALTDAILHVDFTRVEADTAVTTHVRITYKGTAAGTTTGGVLQTLEEALEISAKPRDIPTEILIDISELDLGDSIRASEVPMPSGVERITGEDVILIQVTSPKAVAEDEEGAEGEGAEGEAAADGEAAAEGGDSAE